MKCINIEQLSELMLKDNNKFQNNILNLINLSNKDIKVRANYTETSPGLPKQPVSLQIF